MRIANDVPYDLSLAGPWINTSCKGFSTKLVLLSPKAPSP